MKALRILAVILKSQGELGHPRSYGQVLDGLHRFEGRWVRVRMTKVLDAEGASLGCCVVVANPHHCLVVALRLDVALLRFPFAADLGLTILAELLDQGECLAALVEGKDRAQAKAVHFGQAQVAERRWNPKAVVDV